MIKLIDRKLIDQTIEHAQHFDRKRSVYRFHEDDQEKIQRMLNAVEPDSYASPHKHEDPDKVEASIALKGKFVGIVFDDKGEVAQHQVFGPNLEVLGIEFTPRSWHVVWSLEEGSVLYEIIEGPYLPHAHKQFAPWAPKEEEIEGGREYMQKVKQGLNL